jgi:hypothetical protein
MHVVDRLATITQVREDVGIEFGPPTTLDEIGAVLDRPVEKVAKAPRYRARTPSLSPLGDEEEGFELADVL